MNKTLKKTKIIATLGPSTSTKEIMKEMVLAGTNIFRINFSHADYAIIKNNVKIIREINEELGTSVGILGDLQGPKLRIGVVKEGLISIPVMCLPLRMKMWKETVPRYI